MKRFLTVLGISALLIGFLLVFAIYLRPNLIISKVEEKARYSLPESKFIHWRGAEIHYTDTGKGPAILMIHGFGGCFTNFAGLAAQLQDSFRVIRVDMPGFGLSDFPELTEPNPDYPAVYHSFANFFIDHLKLDSVYVIGNSLGGWVGWELAIKRPDKVKKLVLLDAAGYELDKMMTNVDILKLLRWPITRKLMERGVPLFLNERNAHLVRAEGAPIDMEVIKETNALMNRQGSIPHLINIVNCKVRPDTGRITKVPCPTLIIWGKQDKVLPYQHAMKFRRDIKLSKVILYDNCGHVPMMEYPDKVAWDVRRFFSGGKI